MTAGVGIIGPGAIAELHAAALRDLGHQVLAVAGPDPADLHPFADRHQVPRRYLDADDLLEDEDVEAVIIASPNATHHALTKAAIDAGKATLCEVPLSMSHREGRELVRQAERNGVLLGVAHTLRYWEPHRRIVQELTELGVTASNVVVRCLMLRQSNQGWTGKERTWTDSVIWHYGSHAVDAALWFLGDLSVVASDIRIGQPWRNGMPMDAAIALRTADGRVGSVSLSFHSRITRVDFLVIAEEATFEITGGNLYRDGELILENDVADAQSAALRAQDAAFLRAAAGTKTGFYDASRALPTLRVLGHDNHQSGGAEAPDAQPTSTR